MDRDLFLLKCNCLIKAYHNKELGYMKMPEDEHPNFYGNQEKSLSYFSLPMALNYQRNSYMLWESALKTYIDPETNNVFDIKSVINMPFETLQSKLLKYKLALQPNKHTSTRSSIATTVYTHYGSRMGCINSAENDFLKLQQIIQKVYKRGFPYLSGPKIFHYWSYILGEYVGIQLSNKEYIEIAPDTHVLQASITLGVLTIEEAEMLSKDKVSEKWRILLHGSGISPIDMHSPLRFWSRNNFAFQLSSL